MNSETNQYLGKLHVISGDMQMRSYLSPREESTFRELACLSNPCRVRGFCRLRIVLNVYEDIQTIQKTVLTQSLVISQPYQILNKHYIPCEP
jgi:hypothetical protein